jgi:hypothetical protein
MFINAAMVSVLIITVIVIILLALAFNYIAWTRKRYILEANRLVTVDSNETREPGNIILETGLIFKRIKVYSLEEFSRCELRKGIISSIVNASHIYLRGDKYIKLAFVVNGEEELIRIQHLLDELKINLRNTRIDVDR